MKLFNKKSILSIAFLGLLSGIAPKAQAIEFGNIYTLIRGLGIIAFGYVAASIKADSLNRKKERDAIKATLNSKKILISNQTEQCSPTLINLTQSQWEADDIHLLTKFGIPAFFNDPHLSHIVPAIIQKESELNTNGFYTFIHGQRRNLYFTEKLFTFLWNLQKKQPTDNNFLCLHIKDNIDSEENKNKEKIIRKALRAKGTTGLDIFESILFINYALFANAKNPGCASTFWAFTNDNCRNISISAKEIFKKFDYEPIYQKHSVELEQLANDYLNISKYGNIFLIAIPKERINKYVYLAHADGRRISLDIEGLGQTSDTQIIIETLINHPEKISEETIEFCLIMTQHKGGLDPATGIQVHPFLSGDPEKLKILKQREDALFAKIKADIEGYEKQQNKSINRAAVLANQVAQSAQANAIVPAQAMGRMQKIVNHLATK